MEKIRSNNNNNNNNDHIIIDHEIPIVEFRDELLSEETSRTRLSEEVREACEKYGCFVVKYEEIIPMKTRGQIFMATKALFDLPEETKRRHCSSKPYHSYAANCPVIPLSQSFGIEDGSSRSSIDAFTRLMWPLGNPHFCENVSHMGEKLTELCFTILRMVLESFGMEKHYDSHVQGTSSVLRLMKYRAGGSGDDSARLGLLAHTDKSVLTILCQNEVQGIEILTKQGSWIQVKLPKSSYYVVFVGDALKAWSNGRVDASTHRVMLREERERYSCGVFLVPKEGFTIEVPHDLVDMDHPLLYRPFIFSDFLSFFVSDPSPDALEVYAGLPL